jgi:hypothetical protein
MTIENIFYAFGIFYSVVGSLLMIMVGMAVLFLCKKLNDLSHVVEKKFEPVTETIDHPEKSAYSAGEWLADILLGRIVQKLTV